MYIGIDIGGTNIKGILANREGDILNYKKISTGKSQNEIEDNICEIIHLLPSKDSANVKGIKAVGIGAAGSINKEKGRIITSPNIRYWENYPIVKRIEKKIGIRVILENDATAAVIGEWWKGHGRRFKNWFMLTLGTGIGGGAIIDNKLYTGQSGSSMEFGHTSIDYRGKKCTCGNVGCLEQYSSATALVKFTRRDLKKFPGSSINSRKKNEKLTAQLIYEEALKGDEFSILIFRKVATYLGIGIANLVNIFNPEAVILAGGLSRAHRFLIPVVKETVTARALPGLKERVKYLVIKDEEKSPALGAAKLAIDTFPRS
jgi:glucokinase